MRRTLFGITWSCLSTIVMTHLCVDCHVLNLPTDSAAVLHSGCTLESVEDHASSCIMFWMIIAQELVVAWAVPPILCREGDIRDSTHRACQSKGQHYAPRKKKKKTDLPNWKKWSLKQGHLLRMGGFTQTRKDAELNVKKHSVSDIEIPTIRTARI
jgi:hypothetical protein